MFDQLRDDADYLPVRRAIEKIPGNPANLAEMFEDVRDRLGITVFGNGARKHRRDRRYALAKQVVFVAEVFVKGWIGPHRPGAVCRRHECCRIRGSKTIRETLGAERRTSCGSDDCRRLGSSGHFADFVPNWTSPAVCQ